MMVDPKAQESCFEIVSSIHDTEPVPIKSQQYAHITKNSVITIPFDTDIDREST